MQFLGNFGKIVCWHPWGVGAPSSGKSWIHHWLWGLCQGIAIQGRLCPGRSLSRGPSVQGRSLSGRPPPPVNRMTDRCKNITFRQTFVCGTVIDLILNRSSGWSVDPNSSTPTCFHYPGKFVWIFWYWLYIRLTETASRIT